MDRYRFMVTSNKLNDWSALYETLSLKAACEHLQAHLSAQDAMVQMTRQYQQGC